jgi:raffinose/stachyose/melibiose transport system permease protein
VKQQNLINRMNSSYWVATLPGFLIFLSVVLIPFFIGFGYSFTAWNGIGKHAAFIGLDNYKDVLTDDPKAIASILFTARFTISVVIISNLFGFLLALGITALKTGQGPLRVVFFLPNVIGGLILGFIWRFLLINGLPAVGELLHIEVLSSPWLGDASTAFWGTVIVYVWKTAGYLMVIYIAALLSIDQNLFDAAHIDGARALSILFRIKIPLIMPAITVCLFLMLSWAFKLFDVIFSLTGGGPFGATESFALNIYNEAFLYNNYGYASAKAVVFTILVALLTLLQVKATKSREVQA